MRFPFVEPWAESVGDRPAAAGGGGTLDLRLASAKDHVAVVATPAAVRPPQAVLALAAVAGVVSEASRWPYGLRLRVPLAVVPALKAAGQECGVVITVDAAASRVADWPSEAGTAAAEARLVATQPPSGAGRGLSPTQQRRVAVVMATGGRSVLYDAPGEERAAQALAVARAYPRDRPLLVVCHSARRDEWLDATARELPDGAAVVTVDDEGTAAALGEEGALLPPVVLTSYRLLRGMAPATVRRFEALIIDDADHLIDRKRATAALLLQAIERARRVVLAAGTPAIGAPRERCLLVAAVHRCHLVAEAGWGQAGAAAGRPPAALPPPAVGAAMGVAAATGGDGRPRRPPTSEHPPVMEAAVVAATASPPAVPPPPPPPQLMLPPAAARAAPAGTSAALVAYPTVLLRRVVVDAGRAAAGGSCAGA